MNPESQTRRFDDMLKQIDLIARKQENTSKNVYEILAILRGDDFADGMVKVVKEHEGRLKKLEETNKRIGWTVGGALVAGGYGIFELIRKLFPFIVIMLLFTSCSILSKKTKVNDIKEVISSASDSSRTNIEINKVTFNDINGNYSVVLFPKGGFKMSSTGEFTGEADSVKITGSYDDKSKEEINLNLSNIKSSDSTRIEKTDKSTSDNDASVSAFNWKQLILPAVIIVSVLIGFIIYRLK